MINWTYVNMPILEISVQMLLWTMCRNIVLTRPF